jgi:hypothetical protein
VWTYSARAVGALGQAHGVEYKCIQLSVVPHLLTFCDYGHIFAQPDGLSYRPKVVGVGGCVLHRTCLEVLLVPGGGLEPPQCYHRRITSNASFAVPMNVTLDMVLIIDTIPT